MNMLEKENIYAVESATMADFNEIRK